MPTTADSVSLMRSASDKAAISSAERPTMLPERVTPTVQVPAATPSPMPGRVSSIFTTVCAGQMPICAIACHIISGLGRPGGRPGARADSDFRRVAACGGDGHQLFHDRPRVAGGGADAQAACLEL